MATVTKAVLKTYFEQGDIPTQGQYVDLIDSQFGLGETGTQIIQGTISASAAEFEQMSFKKLHLPSNGVGSMKVGTTFNIGKTLEVFGSLNLNILYSGSEEDGWHDKVVDSGSFSASGDLIIRNITASGDLIVGETWTDDNNKSPYIIIAGDKGILFFSGSAGGESEGIQYLDTGSVGRYGLLFPGNNDVILANRSITGSVQIRANTSTVGQGGEVTSSIFTSFSNEFLYPITASGAISASGMIQASDAFFSNDITSSGAISASGELSANYLRIGGTVDNTTYTFADNFTNNRRAFSVTTTIPGIDDGEYSPNTTVTNGSVLSNSVVLASTSAANLYVLVHTVRAGSFKFKLVCKGTDYGGSSEKINFIVL